jgi:nitrogen fixation NifU-like protein
MSDNDDLDRVAQHVLDHYEGPYHHGDCPHATHSCRVESVLCGDWLRVDLVISAGDQVLEAWFDGDGCVISQATASMLVEKIEGMSLEQLRRFSATDALALFGAGLLPNRQKCCLLAWRAVQRAIPRSNCQGDARTPAADG